MNKTFCYGLEIEPNQFSGCLGGADCPACEGNSINGECVEMLDALSQNGQEMERVEASLRWWRNGATTPTNTPALPDEMVRKATEAAYSLNYCTEWAASKIAEAALHAADVPGLLALVERLQARVYERGEAIATAERERDEARKALAACLNCFECENTLSNAVIQQARRVLGKEEELGKPE